MLESENQQLIKIEIRHEGCTLMRNNSGLLYNDRGTPVRYGLGNVSQKDSELFKSSDEIGITEVVITQEMVGKTIGVFTAVEMKRSDWNPNKKLDGKENAQKNFIDFVNAKGGIAFFAWSKELVRQQVRDAIDRLKR